MDKSQDDQISCWVAGSTWASLTLPCLYRVETAHYLYPGIAGTPMQIT